MRRLVDFALAELPAMRLSDGMYCLEVHASDMRPQGRSLRYSAMTALGLLRAQAAGYETGVDVDALVELIMAEARHASLHPGDIGLCLWLAERAGRKADHTLKRRLAELLGAAGGLAALEGQEVAWIALGTAAQDASRSGGNDDDVHAQARRQLCRHNRAPSGLLYHRGGGSRRRFPNFATQIYGILALSRLGALGDEEALEVAREVADAIIALQRPNGGWPWIFDAQRGRVVEPFEVYSVHQDAMAPMGLFELYEATGEERYREAAVRGLPWLEGANELGRPMLDAERRILYRSIRRRAPWDRALLYLNSGGAMLGAAPAAGWDGPLELNPTDRPYHLGWVLEAWCGREELAGA